MFDGKTKAIQLSYLIGLELFGGNIYLKAESAKHFNEWIVVSLLVYILYLWVQY